VLRRLHSKHSVFEIEEAFGIGDDFYGDSVVSSNDLRRLPLDCDRGSIVRRQDGALLNLPEVPAMPDLAAAGHRVAADAVFVVADQQNRPRSVDRESSAAKVESRCESGDDAQILQVPDLDLTFEGGSGNEIAILAGREVPDFHPGSLAESYEAVAVLRGGAARLGLLAFRLSDPGSGHGTLTLG